LLAHLSTYNETQDGSNIAVEIEHIPQRNTRTRTETAEHQAYNPYLSCIFPLKVARISKRRCHSFKLSFLLFSKQFYWQFQAENNGVPELYALSLTPYICLRVLVRKLIVAHLVKKFSVFYGRKRDFTVSTRHPTSKNTFLRLCSLWMLSFE
jgi:hypothetical protein